MRSTTVLALLTLLVSSVTSAQSLSEIAKKERERRAKNTGAVTVVDDSDLNGYERTPKRLPATEDVELPPPPADDVEPSELAQRQADFRAQRAACSERLAQAQRELTVEEKRLQQGVIRWGEAPTTFGGYAVVDAHGQEETVGAFPGYYRYEQGRVSCLMATRNRGRYPDEAEQCDAITAGISDLRAVIASGCTVPE